jgi:ubiquinol oxidase
MVKYRFTRGRDVDLKAEQERTLSTPTLPANLILKSMFLTFDILYGRARTLPKVKVLEILARYPYWAWEWGGYLRLSRAYSTSKYRTAQDTELPLRHIEMGRDLQDNEQWHLMLVEDIMRQKGLEQGWVRMSLMPRLLAFTYYYLTRIMYKVRPSWSFAMNAAFESHAEHEYMKMSKEHPEWDDEPLDSHCFKFYPRQKTLGDLLRRIALDERDHMYDSLEELGRLKNGGGGQRIKDEASS